MEYFVVFNLILLLLFFLSRLLTSQIYLFFHKGTRNESVSTGILYIIFFPGVLVHELSHYLTAKFLFVPTGKISLFPKREGNYIKLGSVSVAQSNILKEFLIGVSPLVVGTFLIIWIVYFFLTDLSNLGVIKVILSGYCIFVISNTMYASRKDLQAALPFMVTFITLGIISIIIGIRIPEVTASWLPIFNFSKIFFLGSIYLGIPIAIDLMIILLIRFFGRMW